MFFKVGTGIFTNPAAVMVLTGSKTVSMVLWFVGGLYSFIWWVKLRSTCISDHIYHRRLIIHLSLLIYLEFASAFHYNGGELIYVRL